MIELQRVNPSQQIQHLKPLSPLADAFTDALMQVETKGHANNGEVELAIADAIAEYCLIGLDPWVIVNRLLGYL